MIFVDISNKGLLEQHLEDYATWMPYGFGGKGMLGLYPTNEHSEAEIIEQLQKYQIPYYTEVTEAIVLSESGNDAADESYKGIFIDRKTGDFKILTGRFPDKKAMINKYGTLGKDYIARKVFEKPVFDWILNNAKSSLDSYLMFSTAFSKWRHNSILDKYYMKLINDMPQLFKNVRAQDKIGGDNKAKGSDKESAELDEAQYQGDYNDIVGGKIYLVAYGENGILADYTDSAPISYSRNQYDFDSVELFNYLQKAVEETEEDTGEKVIGVAVKTSKKDSHPKMYSREQIDKGFTRDAGRLYSQDSERVQSPDQEKIRFLVYCKDDEGRRIIPRPYPTNIAAIIDKENGFNDYQVWLTAQQALNTADHALNRVPQDGDEVFIRDNNTGEEKWANRRSVNTNVHNMEPGQTNFIRTAKGNIANPQWSKVKYNGDFKAQLNAMRQGNKSVSIDTTGQSSEPAHATGRKTNKISSFSFESAEEVRPEIKELIEAYGVYDLPDEPDLDKVMDQKDTVRLYVKNDMGKDDAEVVLVNLEDDRCYEDVVNAANKLKSRNPGKKIFFTINNENEQQYGL